MLERVVSFPNKSIPDAVPIPKWTDAEISRMRATEPTDEEWAKWRGAIGLGTPVASDILEVAEKSETLNVLIAHVDQRRNALWNNDIYIPACVTADGTDGVATLVVHGRDEAGDQICVNVHNFYPYFYVSHVNCLSSEEEKHLANELRAYIECELDVTRKWASRQNYLTQLSAARASKNAMRVAKLRDPGDTVIAVIPQRRISCFDSRHQERTFFKIVVRAPKFISKARALFTTTDNTPSLVCGSSFVGHVFEAGVRFENRFMVDRKLIGGGWMGIPKTALEERPREYCQSTAAREYDVDFDSVHGYDLDDTNSAFLYERPVTFRALSYDLEAPPKEPRFFPHAEEIPIIQVGTTIALLSDGLQKKETVVFTIGTSDDVPDRRVCCYPTEREMLNAFGMFMSTFDPDIVTGYNTRGFDDPFLCNRAYKVGAEELISCGRDKLIPMTMSRKVQQSNNVGNREYYKVDVAGRVMYDMMPFIQDTYNPNSARLNYVAKMFLNEQKDDMGYDLIRPFFEGNAMTRRVLVSYCAKDAELPLMIAEKLMPFTQLVELARVTGVQMAQIMGQGQTIRTKILILREINDSNLTLEYRPGQPKVPYKGALVAVPIPGYYEDKPISVLDFSSLYPSIICGNNLCGSTYVPPEEWNLYPNDTLTICPVGHKYLKYDSDNPDAPNTFRGILPRVLEKILAKRRDVKKLVAGAKKQTLLLLVMVLTARELALKVVANSGYGFCGTPTTVSLWYVADSTTAYGRWQITRTKELVEEKFTVANGYPSDAECVYGDTDSVMVDFGITVDLPSGATLVEDCPHCEGHYGGCKHCRYGKVPHPAVLTAIATVITLSHAAAEYCSGFFVAPNKLEFENVYWPWLLLKVKKRYAGPFWVDATAPLKTKSRGLETVRGDHALVARDAQETVLNYLLYRLDPQGAVEEVRRRIKALRMGTLDMSKLVTSRKLGKAYNTMPDHERKAFIKKRGRAAYKAKCDDTGVYSNRQPHSELSHKLEKRTGKGYDLGERVPFVITRSTNKKARVCDRAEDPMYALKNNIPLDIEYYMTDVLNCVVNVLAPVFEPRLAQKRRTQKITNLFTPLAKQARSDNATVTSPVADNEDEIIFPRSYKYGDLTRAMILDSPDCRGIRLYKHITPDTDDTVEDDDDNGDIISDASEDDLYEVSRDANRRKVPAATASLMSRYVILRKKCAGCGNSVEMGGNGIVCKYCVPDIGTLRLAKEIERERRVELCDAAWNKCKDCQSQSVRGIAQSDLTIPGYTPESCKEFTCDNFFHRRKVTRDVTDIEDIICQLSTVQI